VQGSDHRLPCLRRFGEVAVLKMKRMIKIGFYLGLTTAGFAIIFAQQKKATPRNLYDDQTCILQGSQGPHNEQEYLLSGSKLGLAAALTFTAKTPTEARIVFGSGKSLSVHSAGDRLVASFFQAEKNGEIIILYDLDTNGSWDVRMSRFGCAIFLNAEWHEASKIEGILSGVPQANVDSVQYEFSGGAWKPAAGNVDFQQKK
jgi:hypothetical protein